MKITLYKRQERYEYDKPIWADEKGGPVLCAEELSKLIHIPYNAKRLYITKVNKPANNTLKVELTGFGDEVIINNSFYEVFTGVEYYMQKFLEDPYDTPHHFRFEYS